MALGLDYIDQAHVLLSWKELYLCVSNLCLNVCNIIVEQVQVFASLRIELSPQKILNIPQSVPPIWQSEFLTAAISLNTLARTQTVSWSEQANMHA